MKFKIINSDQGHNYTHYVDAPDRQTAMDRFKAGHYGSIIDCEEVNPVAEDKKAPQISDGYQPTNTVDTSNPPRQKAPVESIEEQMNKPRFELHPAWSEDEYILASEIWKILKSEAGTSGKKRVIEEIRKHDSNVVQRYEAMIGALEAVTDLMKLPTDEDKVEQFYEALEKYNYLKLKK